MKTQKIQGANYVRQQRRGFFIYTIETRAIPQIADGLKAAGRRLLWVARDGKKDKTATVAGAALPYHPHAVPDDVASLLACPFLNNYPVFTGIGVFGTMLAPESYAAPRYTSIKVSDFTKDVIFRDLDIIPMKMNYDDSLQEPVHYLPLVPMVIINPSEGLTGGFKSTILPRSLKDVIAAQIKILEESKVSKPIELTPKFLPTNNVASKREVNEVSGNVKWTFEGEYEGLNASELCITNLPYGTVHSTIVNHLSDLVDSNGIVDYKDESRDSIRIHVKLGKGSLNRMTREEVLKLLKLVNTETEILNVLDFDGTSVKTYKFAIDIVRDFTEWRLTWYEKRYQHLKEKALFELQRFYDIRTAILKNVNTVARKVKSRGELKEYLSAIKIVNLDYIADLPVYRFTEEEKVKNEERITEVENQIKEYDLLLSSEKKRRTVYIQELQEVLKQYC